jgi:hypothetical protein
VPRLGFVHTLDEPTVSAVVKHSTALLTTGNYGRLRASPDLATRIQASVMSSFSTPYGSRGENLGRLASMGRKASMSARVRRT